MTSPTPFLESSLHVEQALLARELSDAKSEKDFAKVASDALSFATKLLAERTCDRNTSNFMGVAFWYFDSLLDFTNRWPKIALNDLGIDTQENTGGASVEDSAIQLVSDLKETLLIVLFSRENTGTPVLVVDASLANEAALIRFLFAIALKRLPTSSDFEALAPFFAPAEGKETKSVLLNVFHTVLKAPEAEKHTPGWTLSPS